MAWPFKGRLRGLPPRYRGGSWARVTEPVREALQTLLREPERYPEGTGALVCGPPGSGKSQLLGLLSKDTGGEYWPAAVLFDTLHRGETDDRERIGKWAGTGMYPLMNARGPLLIDDVGAEYASEFGLVRFQTLVEEWYACRAPLFVTSNLTPRQLAEREGWERIVDRWREVCLLLELPESSRRTPPRLEPTQEVTEG